MPYFLHPGNFIGCAVNSHRSGWNGVVCTAAATWNCSAQPQFREDYCERGDDRCFHVYLFDEKNPHFVISENGAAWILEDEPAAFDDQLLLLWGRQFHEPRGVREGEPVWVMFGAYRIRTVEARHHAYRTDWVVRPHADGWARFDSLRLSVPRWQEMNGPYIKQIERRGAQRMFEQAQESASDVATTWRQPDDEPRLRRFIEHVDEWTEIARARAEQLEKKRQALSSRTTTVYTTAVTRTQPLRNLPELLKQSLPGAASAGAVSIDPAASLAADAHDAAQTTGVQASGAPLLPILDESARKRIAARHGMKTLTSILVASLTKPLLILRGDPGVGKSDLALGLLDDPKRERSHIVAVSSTWRGREDLFGYINPINSLFEATQFTNFLHEAESAWDAGDRRPRLVIFEEFNLSQPEYWLSDIVVRSQYPAGARRDRTIELGGEGVRGWRKGTKSEVYLSPCVRFVATLNSDHTIRPLSPRILDRAAVVELVITPREAMQRCGLDLEEAYVEAIADLDFRIRAKGATFSYRTAQSLKACLDHAAELGLEPSSAIDLILMQELLSKVRLLAADSADQHLAGDLVAWSEGPGKKLFECARVIATWRDLLQNGQDVQQL